MKKPLIIGITGGIGGGKSTLSNLLRLEGYKVFDTDLVARQLQNEHPVIKQQIVELFGNEIYNENGLNRKELATIVFQNKDLLFKLSQIIHPVVRSAFQTWIEENNLQSLLFVESAILFENGFNTLVDKVIVMTASVETRTRRVVKRDKIDIQQVQSRIANQLPEQIKMERADFIIHSDDGKPLYDKMINVLAILNKI